ncbi:retrovirus-related pol polyprotein from transposon TNT 1-94 [Tanacetum coccineum]
MALKKTTTPMTDAAIKALITQGVVMRCGLRRWNLYSTLATAPLRAKLRVSISVWNPEESDQVEKYVGGLPDMIQGSNSSNEKNIGTVGLKIFNVVRVLEGTARSTAEKIKVPLLFVKVLLVLSDILELEDLRITEDQVSTIIEPVSNVKPSPTIISPSFEVFINPHVPQDRWFREKHIKLVNILGEPQVGVTTRSRIRDSKAASVHACLYVNFLSEIEPKKLIEALEEEGWIIAMQEELNQFEKNNIDYDETFAHVARLEAIRIFLAYAAYMGFVVFQMDVKSAFLNGKILEEVYVQQPPRFEISKLPNHVCKLVKALYGLKQAPKAWYETLSKFLLQHKFVRGPDESGVFVNETLFRGMIGLPMYLTASRPDIQFSICLCIRYRIIRDHFLKGDIELHFVPTELQLAGIFTKPLTEPSFIRLVVELGMINIEKGVPDKKKVLSDPLT